MHQRGLAIAVLVALYQLAVPQLCSSQGFLPTGGAAVTAAAPAGGAQLTAAPQLQPAPTPKPQPTRAFAAGGCGLNVAASYQCGGNMSSAVASCADFASCSNTAWPGACCPAGITCQQTRGDLNTCWSCGGTVPAFLAATQPPPAMCEDMAADGDYNYPCVLGASLLFYEAQRSGRLPADNRIKWRGNAGLADKDPLGKPLIGGWYDAGDTTKFTFPAAWALGNLALAYLEFPEAFNKAGQQQYALQTLKWGADYLMACRFSPNQMIVASWGPKDTIPNSHLWWGRPEDITTPSRMLVLNSTMQGSDLLGQAAGALAAVSMAFAGVDADYATTTLDMAKSLYLQAADSQGIYSRTFPAVEPYYRSFSHLDDLTWAAAWLAHATKESDYVDQAKFFWKRHVDEEGGGEGRRYDYNNMIQANGYIMAKIDSSSKDTYLKPIRDTMDLWLNAKSSIEYSPKGMAWIDTWGNLRYVANQAFMGLLHAKAYSQDTRRNTVYTCFARKQMRYILGEQGNSYVVGVGTNPPCQPHHRGASCGPLNQPCDCTAFASKACNPNVIFGGLVGGPGKDDSFSDNRLNFAALEVALDWNAGFTGVMAALSSGDYPTWQDCNSAGQADGRGQIPAALNAAGSPAGSSQLALWLSLVAAALGSWLWL